MSRSIMFPSMRLPPSSSTRTRYRLDDPDEASGEDRFVMIGLSAQLRVLATCHCVRGAGNVIRVISARRAVRAEQRQYWERLNR